MSNLGIDFSFLVGYNDCNRGKSHHRKENDMENTEHDLITLIRSTEDPVKSARIALDLLIAFSASRVAPQGTYVATPQEES